VPNGKARKDKFKVRGRRYINIEFDSRDRKIPTEKYLKRLIFSSGI
jgi:hypothetical protein